MIPLFVSDSSLIFLDDSLHDSPSFVNDSISESVQFVIDFL